MGEEEENKRKKLFENWGEEKSRPHTYFLCQHASDHFYVATLLIVDGRML